MILLAMTDLHGRREMLDGILKAAGPVDAILLGGDLTNFGTPQQAAELLACARQPGVPVWAVAGNCDSAEIERLLFDEGVGLHARAVVVEQVGIQGLSAAPPWLPHMYHFSEDQLAGALQSGRQQLPDVQCHVVLAHVPPRDCPLDRTAVCGHVGSRALRSFVDEHQPDLVVCGHIHEARGIAQLGRTLVVNCGAASGGCYALVRVNQRVEVELCELR